MDPNARRTDLRSALGRALHRIFNLHHRRYFDAVRMGEQRRLQPKRPRPEDHDPAACQRLVARGQCGKALRAHHTGLVPAWKAQHDIACAGCQHQPVEPDHHCRLAIGDPEQRFGQGAHRRPVAVEPPGHSAEPHIDAEFERLFQIGIGAKHLLKHPPALLHRCRGAAAEEIGDVGADQRARHGMLVDQQDGVARLRSGDRSDRPGMACADHDQIEMRLGMGDFGVERVDIAHQRHHVHIASSAWARSAIRSSTCSIPTERRSVAGVMPPAARSSGEIA